MTYHTEKRDIPAKTGFMSHDAKTVYVIVNSEGNESWECAVKESADLRCAALNFDLVHGGRSAEIVITEFLEKNI